MARPQHDHSHIPRGHRHLVNPRRGNTALKTEPFTKHASLASPGMKSTQVVENASKSQPGLLHESIRITNERLPERSPLRRNGLTRRKRPGVGLSMRLVFLKQPRTCICTKLSDAATLNSSLHLGLTAADVFGGLRIKTPLLTLDRLTSAFDSRRKRKSPRARPRRPRRPKNGRGAPKGPRRKGALDTYILAKTAIRTLPRMSLLQPSNPPDQLGTLPSLALPDRQLRPDDQRMATKARRVIIHANGKAISIKPEPTLKRPQPVQGSDRRLIVTNLAHTGAAHCVVAVKATAVRIPRDDTAMKMRYLELDPRCRPRILLPMVSSRE